MATKPPRAMGTEMAQSESAHKRNNPKTDNWVKRDTTTGRFMDVKQDGTPFKGVTKEPTKRK